MGRRIRAIFGWTRDEALGARLSELIIPEHQRAIHEYGLTRYKATGQGKFIGKPIEIVTLNRDGGEVPDLLSDFDGARRRELSLPTGRASHAKSSGS